ncbi:hypothetical protein AcV5_009636 [Taiwanofungus camphoratus]|nr:hypothetical protein AcV5_009636 [Antrodia cinnamomea]KAI0942925.1 hypothetical protein AcV7_002207 [Antrodia cinnamomea]
MAGEIVITDMMFSSKVAPTAMTMHLWTFGGKLNVRLTYNAGRTSDALTKPYFERVVDTVTRLCVEERAASLTFNPKLELVDAIRSQCINMPCVSHGKDSVYLGSYSALHRIQTL